MDLSPGNFRMIFPERFLVAQAIQPDLSDAETVLSLSDFGPHFMKTASLNFSYEISDIFRNFHFF